MQTIVNTKLIVPLSNQCIDFILVQSHKQLINTMPIIEFAKKFLFLSVWLLQNAVMDYGTILNINM